MEIFGRYWLAVVCVLCALANVPFMLDGRAVNFFVFAFCMGAAAWNAWVATD